MGELEVGQESKWDFTPSHEQKSKWDVGSHLHFSEIIT